MMHLGNRTILLIASLLIWTAAAPAGPGLTPFPGNLEAASRRYLGTPYRLFALGEGSAQLGSPKPLIDEKGVDCVTFVEQSLAHALAERPSEIMPLLQRIRYREGKIHFGERNHYTLADWMPNNAWLVEDDTRRIGGVKVSTTRKVLDRGLPAREHRLPKWRASLPPGSAPLEVAYIPSGAVGRLLERFPVTAIVAFVPPRRDMDASHVGFVFRRDGWILRHASSSARKVVDVPLVDYLKRRGKNVLGVVVMRIRPR